MIGHVGATRRARSHDDGNLRNARSRHLRLIEEDTAEVLAIGKHFRLQRQERATRIDEIHTRQVVLQCHLLCTNVLLDGQRVIRAAFDGGVVRHDDHVATRHSPDARHNAGRWRIIVVHGPCG
jgi:hypothetical protein